LRRLIVEARGPVAAYTLIFVSGADAHQEDTRMPPAGRGHRLGTVAKARNLRALASSHPSVRRVHTWTADVNDPMRRINDTVGFRPAGRMYAFKARLRPSAE
jgi:hypothetical protein